MNEPVPDPEHTDESRDPLAIAIANASLLSSGYLLLGRRKLALGTGLVTVVLVTLLATVAREVWLEIVVVVWWVAVTVHGWFLARGLPRQERAGKQRFVALAITVPVLVGVSLIRLDASRIEQDVADARRGGDCTRALSNLDRLRAGHRVADAPLTARGEATVEACDLLRKAADRLGTAVNRSPLAVTGGFGLLSRVLAELPGHEQMVGKVLDGFLAGLSPDEGCSTMEITDWLGSRKADGTVLDRAREVVPRVAPAAIMKCADGYVKSTNWDDARKSYEQLLKQYPDHEFAAAAKQGVQQAVQATELAILGSLLPQPGAPYSTGLPDYCTRPAAYSGAAPYRAKSPNRALFFGDDARKSRLPADWQATGAADAVLVICIGEDVYGAPVRSCLYTTNDGKRHNVTFHRIVLPVRVFEVRTGQLVADTKVDMGGEPCPDYYFLKTEADGSPIPQGFVIASDADMRAAFNPFINP